MKIRDMSRNTWSKEWLQALKLRAISFLVLWSWPRSTSHNKGNIKLRTSRALRVCRIVMHCSFGFVLCHRDSPIICLGEHLFTFFHFEKILDILMNTSNKEWLQALTLRAIACATEVSNMLSFFYLERSTRHYNEDFKQRRTSSSQITRD